MTFGDNEISPVVQRFMHIVAAPEKRLCTRIVRQMTERVHKIRSHFMIIPYIL